MRRGVRYQPARCAFRTTRGQYCHYEPGLILAGGGQSLVIRLQGCLVRSLIVGFSSYRGLFGLERVVANTDIFDFALTQDDGAGNRRVG